MKKLSCFALIGVAAMLVGCAAPPQRVVLNYPFDAAAAAALLRPGPNTITGSALMRQVGGGVVTCAGIPVRLIPATDYAERRMNVLYGSGRYVPITKQRVVFEPEEPAYIQQQRVSTCNAQGFFRFDGVADGSYFIISVITWRVGEYNLQGGGLMAKIQVRGGETLDVTLAP